MITRHLKKILKKDKAATSNNLKQIIIGDYKLTANSDHKLEEYLLLFPEYSQNFPRIAHDIMQEKPGATIIDIGANIGDTIALLRKFHVTNHVFCVEGDENYFSLLQQNAKQMANVTLLKYYLSDTDTSKGYNVEKSGGTARIVEAKDSTIQSPVITLDKLSGHTDFGTVGIIKIDTDGFDCKIIKGGLSLLDKHKPVLFFEYDYDLSKQQNELPLQTLSLLSDKGYSGIIYFDNFGKAICATTLSNIPQLTILDKYIQNGKGAFPYYDVLVFHKDDDALLQKIITEEVKHKFS